MNRLLRLYHFVRSAILAQPQLFLVLFAGLAFYTWFLHHKYPLGPGQDYHFHLMVASISGRSANDPVRALYGSIDPLTANTLLYTLAFPFEKLFDPVRAFQITVTLFYFIGYPLACAVALRRVGRPPWGALLAFPLAWYKDWSLNGFMPFLSAAPFLVLAIGEFHVAQTSEGRRARNAAIACALFCLLTFLAHGHVFVWLALLLAMLTIIQMVKNLGPIAFSPKAAALSSIRAGLLALAIITPALIAFGRWYIATHHGARAADANKGLQIAEWPLLARLSSLPALLSPAVGDTDFVHLIALALVVLTCWFLARRTLGRGSSGLTFEICFLATVVSYFVLPGSFAGGQTIAIRHLSFILWLLPLVLFAADPPRLRLSEWIAVGAVAIFAFVRVQFLGEQLRRANLDDFHGLLPLARECAKKVPPGGELAYASMSRYSKHWRDSWSLHQAHETFAAVCNLDTPVYDTAIYPHNLLPLRYRGNLPAPITILTGDAHWYQRPQVWARFQYVLVHGWTVPQADAEKLLPQAELVARSGDFQLWRKK